MQQSDHRRLPNLFIVGAQKAGTTSLFDWLTQHPAVCGAQTTKDMPFFAEEKLFAQGIESHARLFPRVVEEPYLIAGSVHYLFFPKALPRIRKFCPDAKILVMLRDPVERSISAYRFAVQRGIEKRTFDEAITEELAAQDSDRAYTSKIDRFQKFYVARSLYGQQLVRLYQVVPAEQVFIGIFEEMVGTPSTFMTPLYDFLGLEPLPFECNVMNRTRGMPRYLLLNRIFFQQDFLKNPFMRLLKTLMPHDLRVHTRRRALELITNPNKQPVCKISDAIRQQLQQVFRQDLQQLNKPEAQAWITGWGLGSDNGREADLS